MAIKVFIDGKEGTTGLRIFDRFATRTDIELLVIPEEDRKNPEVRKQCLNASDITFLCLPDAAAIEAVGMLENNHTKIIDTSTAHRTLENWAYGFPELDASFRDKIRNSSLVAVPGCHASGFIAIVYPLIREGILSKDYPLSCTSLTGYSGGGKKMIADYQTNKTLDLEAPRQYAFSQQHKHLKEMQKITGLTMAPIFEPIVSDFYSGMQVSVGLHLQRLNKKMTAVELHLFFKAYYANHKMITVMPFCPTATPSGFLSTNEMSGYDNMFLYVSGNDERVLLTMVYDNLGKGASGAAIECMNIMLGLESTLGLSLKEKSE